MSHRAPAVQAPAPHVRASMPAVPARSRQRDILYDAVSRAPVVAAVLTLVAIYAVGLGSVLLAPAGSKIAVWWPAAGLSVALLVLAPRRRRLLLTLGVVVFSGMANHTAGREPLSALCLGISNASEAYVVAWWLTRHLPDDRRPGLRTMDELWRLVLGTVIGHVIAGVGIGLTVAYTMDGSFLLTFRSVTASHAAAILAFTPVALAVNSSQLASRPKEAAAQWLLLLVSLGYIFSPDQKLSLTFLPLPLLLWAGVRFGVRTVSYQLVAMGLITSALTAMGGGPFAVGEETGVTSPSTTATLVQLFLLFTALIVLPLAVSSEHRRTALLQVTASEELFRKTFSESFVGMLLLHRSPEGLRIREANPTAATILGSSPEELVGRLWGPMLATQTDLDQVADLLTTGELDGWRDEMWLAEDGHRRVGTALSPLSTSTGELLYSAQLLDMTEIHDASQRLRSERDFTEAVLGTTACLIVVVTTDGRVAGFNPATERACGFSEHEVLDQPLWGSLLAPEDQQRMRQMFSRPATDGEPPRYEADMLTRKGRRRRVVWSSAPLTDDHGNSTHVVMTGIDVTEERTVLTMINHLLDSASATAFIGFDLRGTITIFNTGAEELLGYSGTDVVNRVRLDMLHEPEELAQVRATSGAKSDLRALVHGVDRAPQTRDWTYVCQDGRRVVAAVTTSAVRDAFGSHIGYLAVGRDVTESRRSQRLLLETLDKEREAIERLQELDRAKSDFVSTVSHELRTPITSIVGYTEMLQDGAAGAVSSAQERLLDAVRRNGERLITLIEDLLTLSRIEAGTFAMRKATIDLRGVVSHAREPLRPMLSGRTLDVTFDLPDEPVSVHGDPAQLERVVLNLLGNAVKFTEDGGRIRCRLRADAGHARIEVSDTGIGIPEAEQAALFTRFFRSSNAQDRAIQGTGLGLSIVQSIVESHGGQISIRSEHQVGTEVDVVLPLATADVLAPAAR